MKKRTIIKKKIVSFAIAAALSLSLLAGGTVSIFATEPGENNVTYLTADDERDYMYIGDYGKTVLPDFSHDTSTTTYNQEHSDDDISALGSHASSANSGGCSVLDGLNMNPTALAQSDIEANKSSDAVTVTANSDGSYTLSWKFTMPATKAFQYSKDRNATIILCSGINSGTDVYHYAGNIAASNSYLNSSGTWQNVAHPWYGLATVKVASSNRNKSKTSVCYPTGRKYLGYDQGASGTYHDVHTTLRSTGYLNRNVYVLKTGIKFTSSDFSGSTTKDSFSKTVSINIPKDTMKKIKKWAKSVGLPKDTDGNYKFTAAITGAAELSSGYTDGGCGWHGVWFKVLNGGAGNGVSQCRISGQGNPGTKLTNWSGIANGNQDANNGGVVYVQDGLECAVSTWSSPFTVPSPDSDYDLVDVYQPLGSTEWVPFDTDYSTKTYAVGATVKVSDWASEFVPHTGYTAANPATSSDTTAVAAGGTLYRYFVPAKYTASCIDRYYKNGQLVTQETNGTTKEIYHGQSISGSAWGNTSPKTGYTYKDCTTATCNAANVTVYRNFDLGSYTVTYHANGGTGNDIVDRAYVGENITLRNTTSNEYGGTTAPFTRTSNDMLWKLVGWSSTSGGGVDYELGTPQNFGLGINGNKDLYAVWQPALKITWDEGVASTSIPGVRTGTEINRSDAITYHAYNTAINTMNVSCKTGNHVKDITRNGTNEGWAQKLASGTALGYRLTDNTVINITTDKNPCTPTKTVVKSGTSTDVNGCLVSEGDKLDYVIHIQNRTNVTRTYHIEDTLDTGVTYVEGSAEENGTYANGKLSWDIVNLPANGEKEWKFTVIVNDTKKGQAIVNCVDTWEKAIPALGEIQDIHETSGDVTNYVMETPVKHLRKTAGSADTIDNTIITAGDEAVYTITVKNPNIADVRTFNVRDVIPSAFEPVSASDGGSISGQTVTWQGITVAESGSKTLTVNVKAKDNLPGEDVINGATFTCTDAYGTVIDSTKVKNFSMKAPEKLVYPTLNENRQLTTEAQITDIDDQVINDGELLTYRLKWKNPTDGTRTLVLKDTIPVGTRIATSADLDRAMEGISLAKEYDYLNGGAYLISNGGVLDEATGELTWTFDSDSTPDGKDEGYVEFTVVVLDLAQDTYVRNKCSLTIVSPTGINENNPTMPSNEVANPVLKTPDKIATRADGQDVTELVVNDGEEITYNITFKNPAEDDRDFIVTDIVPEFTQLKPSSISDGGTYDADANMITWQLTLAGYEEKTVSFTVLVKEEAQNQTVKNTARVYVDRADKKTKEDTPTNIYILEDPTKAVLNVDGEDINGVVKRAGDIITYDIVYKNPADDERVATITDVLPAGLEFVEARHQGSYDVTTGQFVETADKSFPYEYDATTNTIVWTTPTAAKCQEMVSVDVRILDEAKGKVLKNVASVYIPDATKQTNEVSTPVADNPIKTATDKKGQSLGGRIVTLGETFTYDITFTNPAETEKVGFITDTLPTGVDFVSADEKGKYDAGTHTVFWKNIKMAAGETKTVHVTVTVNESAANETIGNEAVYRIDEAVVSSKLEDGGQGGPAMYVATKSVLNKKGEDINTKVVCENNLLVYKITYKNVDNKEKFFTILDVLPEGLKIVNVGDNGFIATTPLNGLEDYKLAKNRSVAWQFYVGPQEEGFVTVTAQVTDEKAGEILYNNAVFAVEDESKPDEKPFVKETNQVENPVLKNPVKTVFNTAGREITDRMVAPGDELTYKITFVNPSPLDKVADIRDTLPQEVKFISCDYDGTYDETTHTVKWADLEVKANERITVSCKVKVKESSGGKTIKNQGTVVMDEAAITTRAKTPSSDPDEPEPSEKKTTDNYVSCKKTYDAEGNDITGDIVKVGDTITYRIYFGNTSDTEKMYTIKDKLPDEVDYVGATGEPSVDGKLLVWNTKLAAGKETYYEVTVTVNDKGYGKVIKNKATIVQSDPESPDDPYETTTDETENPVFDKDDFVKAAVDKKGKNIDNSFVTAGSELNYLITLHNPSGKKVKFTVTDKLPDELKYVASTESGVYDAQSHTVTWVLDLEADAVAKLEIATKVKKTVKSGFILNKAHLVTDSTEMDSNEVKNYVLESPVKEMYAGNKKLKDGEKVTANTSVTFTISYSNPTDVERELTITDVLDKKIVDRVLSISDDGELKDGMITWNLDVPAGKSGEVSFTVSSPDLNGDKVTNKATVTLDNEGLTGKTSLDTNTVYYICVPEDKPSDHPDGDDPGREIVKTGDANWSF